MNMFTMSFDAASKIPLYKQLYRHVAQEIQRGHFPSGDKLPSKKVLSAYLGISQNTVETAYAMLVQEGYVRASPRSGYYVAQVEALVRLPEEDTKDEAIESPPPWRYDFRTNAVDIESFPYATWAKLFKEVMYGQRQLLSLGDSRGELPLRQALASYLHAFRGVKCTPEQIVVGAGIEYLLMLLESILEEYAVFAFENPGYKKSARVLKNSGRAIRYVKLDEGGMALKDLAESDATVAYITPSHQFPTGKIMPVGRRIALINWANERPERYIIEDDYNSEFHFQGKPIPATQGLAPNSKVIYMSTFSRVLTPSVRIAYMVLPLPLMERFNRKLAGYSSTVSRFEQYTLYRFIQEGHLGRHLNRVKNIYHRRRDALMEIIRELPQGKEWNISGERAGLHLLIEIPGLHRRRLEDRAQALGIKLYFLADYYFVDPPKDDTLILGFGGLSMQEMREALTLLFEKSDDWQREGI